MKIYDACAVTSVCGTVKERAGENAAFAVVSLHFLLQIQHPLIRKLTRCRI